MALEIRNQAVLAQAFKRAKLNSEKIKEYGITPDMAQEAQEALIEKLAVAKADRDNVDWTTLVKGQRWYVEYLVKFANLSATERLDAEYELAFPNGASEAEMLSVLEDLC